MIQSARKMSSLSIASAHEGSSYRVDSGDRESHDFRTEEPTYVTDANDAAASQGDVGGTRAGGSGSGGGGGFAMDGTVAVVVASSPSGATVGSDIDGRPGLGRPESYTNPQEAADHGDADEGTVEDDTFSDVEGVLGTQHQISGQMSTQEESVDELNDILSVQSNTTIGSERNYSESTVNTVGSFRDHNLLIPGAPPPLASASPRAALEQERKASTNMEGWLVKQGQRNTAWKRRYFVLRDKRLEYYTDEPSHPNAKLRGAIPLEGSLLYTLDDDENARDGDRVCGFVLQLQLNTKTRDRGMRAFFLKAYAKDSRDCWLEQIRKYANVASCTGWLSKQGHYMRSWHRRWFVLESPALLHYFTGPAGTWKGSVDLTGAHVENTRARPLEIALHTWNDGDKNFLISAADDDNLRKWKRVCEKAASLEFQVFDEDLDGYKAFSPRGKGSQRALGSSF